MINQSCPDRFSVFAESFESDLSPALEQLRLKAEGEGIPIIRREMQGFLRFLLHVRRPSKVLEIGSGVGFSALFMLSCLEEIMEFSDIHIDSIEINPDHVREATEHVSRFDADQTINLIEGDAHEVLNQLNGPYDFIFLDGPKAQYPLYLPRLIDLMNPGDILVADNILKEGEIIESKYAVERRQRTIHMRMRAFLSQAMHDERLTSTILSVGDGVCVSVRK